MFKINSFKGLHIIHKPRTISKVEHLYVHPMSYTVDSRQWVSFIMDRFTHYKGKYSLYVPYKGYPFPWNPFNI